MNNLVSRLQTMYRTQVQDLLNSSLVDYKDKNCQFCSFQPSETRTGISLARHISRMHGDKYQTRREKFASFIDLVVKTTVKQTVEEIINNCHTNVGWCTDNLDELLTSKQHEE